jgi:tetratricopeptide (TPR) repeat protein
MTTLPKSLLAAALFLLFCSGCASLIVNPMLEPLTLSMQKQTDLELLQDGAPSLLLLLDGLIANDPDNERLIMTATKAYGAYAMILNENGETERAAGMSVKAKDYGISLITRLPDLKNLNGMKLGEIKDALAKIQPDKVGNLFWGAYGWATWIRYQEGAPAAMADLPIVELIMLRVVELDESYYYGGKPKESRKHFERALAINKRRFLPTQVAYANTYARMMFDRELYLKLLQEVIDRPVTDSDMASSNALAKQMAKKLLGQVDEIF